MSGRACCAGRASRGGSGWSPATGRRRCRELLHAAITAWASAEPDRGRRPVLAIVLDDYTQASPGASVHVAFEHPDFGGADAIWSHVEAIHGHWIAFDADDGTLLRVGACAGRDVQTETSEAVIRHLRATDSRDILTLSEDLLVYADHSESDPGKRLASARRVNPPDVIDRWLARG
jgi:hypothetical protein